MFALRASGFLAGSLALAWAHGLALSKDGVLIHLIRDRPAWSVPAWDLVSDSLPGVLYFGSGLAVVLLLHQVSGVRNACARASVWRPVLAVSVVATAVVAAYLVEHRQPLLLLYFEVALFAAPFMWLVIHELALWWQIGSRPSAPDEHALGQALRAFGHAGLVWLARIGFVLTSLDAMDLRGENAVGAVFHLAVVVGEITLGVVVVGAGVAWSLTRRTERVVSR